MPKYQTINYKAIKSGVFVFDPKFENRKETTPLPKCLRLEQPTKQKEVKFFLCDPFLKGSQHSIATELNCKKLTGLFETAKDGMFSGDVVINGKRNTVLLSFNNELPLLSEWLKIYYFFGYYVTPNRINNLVYTTFTERQKKGFNF